MSCSCLAAVVTYHPCLTGLAAIQYQSDLKQQPSFGGTTCRCCNKSIHKILSTEQPGNKLLQLYGIH